MNQKRIGYAILGLLILGSAGVLGKWYVDTCGEDIGTCATSKWNNPNFKIMNAASFNYTDYDIYGVYLLPPDKNDLDLAARANGNRATRRDETEWEGLHRSAGLAWDYRWKTPKRFKVWWLRVTDQSVYNDPSNKHDAYTMQHSMPGTAWCEGEIVVTREPLKHLPSDLILHFYPDGRVAGDIEYDIQPDASADISKRDKFPVLTERACIKEIPNPFFGRKRPISIH